MSPMLFGGMQKDTSRRSQVFVVTCLEVFQFFAAIPRLNGVIVVCMRLADPSFTHGGLFSRKLVISFIGMADL